MLNVECENAYIPGRQGSEIDYLKNYTKKSQN